MAWLRREMSHRYHGAVAHLRLFASAREAAGKSRDTVAGSTVREVLEEACGRYGHDFAGLLEICQVWCNGEPAAPNTPVGDDDEIAVLPPVSGGQRPSWRAVARAASERSEQPRSTGGH